MLGILFGPKVFFLFIKLYKELIFIVSVEICLILSTPKNEFDQDQPSKYAQDLPTFRKPCFARPLSNDQKTLISSKGPATYCYNSSQIEV